MIDLRVVFPLVDTIANLFYTGLIKEKGEKELLKRWILVLMTFVFYGLCVGCSLPPSDAESLMQAPKLSEEQMAVDNALKLALGTKDIKLKYPRTGKYRSAYVFCDIDSDGKEEALVFYQPNIEGSGIRISILDMIDGVWTCVYDTPPGGKGGVSNENMEVDYITFENIESQEYKNIIIGWQPENNRRKMISIYTFENNKLNSVYTDTYSQSIIQDFDNDGLMDLVLISLYDHTVTFVTMDDEQIHVADELAISESIRNILQLVSSPLQDGRQAIYMDVALDLKDDFSLLSAEYATEIITIEDGKLVPQINISAVYSDENDRVTQEQIDNFKATRRFEKILSADLDQDGIIEVPSSVPLLGYEQLPEDEQRYLTTFSILENGDMTPLFDACVNVEAGYMVKIPEKWLSEITVVTESNDDQWQFIKYNESLNDHSLELLRINKVSKNDFPDRFDKDSSFTVLLGQKGLYLYYGYLPPTEEKNLEITSTELKSMFILL